MKLEENKNGMSMVGEGRKIILLMLPFLLIGISLHVWLPDLAALPEGLSFIRPLGLLLLPLGLALWAAGVFQLKRAFPEGKLVTTGAFGVVRHPIYSSMAFYILPAVSLLTLTWVYIVPSIFLCVGVMVFAGGEERELKRVFGKEYEDYMTRVNRMVPLKVWRLVST